MKLYTLLLFFVLPAIGFGQKFNYSKIKTVSIDSLRIKDDGKFYKPGYSIGVSDDYFPNRQLYSLAQPIIYQKEQGNFQKQVSFYYSNSDSAIRLIEYQWEGNAKAAETDFYKIVSNCKKIISNYFNVKPEEIPETTTRAAKSIWQNDSVYVELLSMPAMYRTRVLISWK